MKYFIIVIAILLVASTTVLGYFISQQDKQITIISSPLKSSNEITVLKSQIDKIQLELAELKNTLSRQSFLIHTLKEVPSNSSENQPVYVELFKDPDFLKEFQERVDKLVKSAQQKQAVDLTKRVMKIGEQMLDNAVKDFSKTINLNDYQQQEFSKILKDRVMKTLALSAIQFGPQKLPPEELKIRQETIRNESNEKVKQIFLPEQYEQYQKLESQIANPRQGPGFFGGPQPQQPQQQEQTPQTPK